MPSMPGSGTAVPPEVDDVVAPPEVDDVVEPPEVDDVVAPPDVDEVVEPLDVDDDDVDDPHMALPMASPQLQ